MSPGDFVRCAVTGQPITLAMTPYSDGLGGMGGYTFAPAKVELYANSDLFLTWGRRFIVGFRLSQRCRATAFCNKAENDSREDQADVIHENEKESPTRSHGSGETATLIWQHNILRIIGRLEFGPLIVCDLDACRAKFFL